MNVETGKEVASLTIIAWSRRNFWKDTIVGLLVAKLQSSPIRLAAMSRAGSALACQAFGGP